MRALYYLTLTTIITLVLGPLSNPLEHLSDEPHQVVDEDFEDYLANAGDHPWCGTFDLGEARSGWLQAKADSKQAK